MSSLAITKVYAEATDLLPIGIVSSTAIHGSFATGVQLASDVLYAIKAPKPPEAVAPLPAPQIEVYEVPLRRRKIRL